MEGPAQSQKEVARESPSPWNSSVQLGFRVWVEKWTVLESFVGQRQPEGT